MKNNDDDQARLASWVRTAKFYAALIIIACLIIDLAR